MCEQNLYESPKLKAHGAKVVTTVGTAVAGLRNIAALVPTLKSLGKQHVKCKRTSRFVAV